MRLCWSSSRSADCSNAFPSQEGKDRNFLRLFSGLRSVLALEIAANRIIAALSPLERGGF